MIRAIFLTIVTTLLCIRSVHADPDYNPDAGKVEVKSFEVDWKNGDREIPAKIYYPAVAREKLPIIIFSHGLGGSREGYSYLGQYWASHGYVSVHLTHRGSDTQALLADGVANLKQQAKAIAADPMNAVDRCKDVSFAIDQMTDANTNDQSQIRGRLDLDRIGMAGHSFGANTTMLIAGETTRTGKSFADPRVKCAIALCPPVPAPKNTWDRTYSTVKIPLFVMTGTKDDSPIGDTTAAMRRVPFDHVQNILAFLITLDGADHMVFGGDHRPRGLPTDAHFHELILQGSTAFWDAYLKENDAAKTWLAEGGYKKAVAASGVLEIKK